VSVQLLGADGGRATVGGWPTGPRTAAGLCPTALAELPAGWPVRAVLRDFTVHPDSAGSATVSVAELPEGATAAVAVRAGGWRLPVLSGKGFGPDRSATLTVGRPVPECGCCRRGWRSWSPGRSPVRSRCMSLSARTWHDGCSRPGRRPARTSPPDPRMRTLRARPPPPRTDTPVTERTPTCGPRP
jgi:hypothetical protein